MIKQIILLGLIFMVGCSDTYPNKEGRFIIIASDMYSNRLSKFRTKSIKGFGDFSFVDSSNKYSVGDTIHLSK